jgi:hypothetical protein
LNFCPWTTGWSFAVFPAKLFPHIGQAIGPISNCFNTDQTRKPKSKDLTILLIGTPLTILPPLLRLSLAQLARRRVSRIWILGLGAEQFTLCGVSLITLIALAPQKEIEHTFPIPVFPNVGFDFVAGPAAPAPPPPPTVVAGEP